MARAGRNLEPAENQPRLRRAYYECRYGQLHLHNAIPPGGGFDELTAVICLHGEGETGAVFLPAMQALGARRSVYALDLPGVGGTDPAADVPRTEAAVNATCDFLDSMRIRSVDLVTRGASAPAALRLLEQRGNGLRRIIVIDPDEVVRNGTRVTVLDGAAATPQHLVELLAHT